ncbi:hypothetical protein FB451DRAFT_1478648, partial [Mycena latifolia]
SSYFHLHFHLHLWFFVSASPSSRETFTFTFVEFFFVAQMLSPLTLSPPPSGLSAHWLGSPLASPVFDRAPTPFPFPATGRERRAFQVVASLTNEAAAPARWDDEHSCAVLGLGLGLSGTGFNNHDSTYVLSRRPEIVHGLARTPPPAPEDPLTTDSAPARPQITDLWAALTAFLDTTYDLGSSTPDIDCPSVSDAGAADLRSFVAAIIPPHALVPELSPVSPAPHVLPLAPVPAEFTPPTSPLSLASPARSFLSPPRTFSSLSDGMIPRGCSIDIARPPKTLRATLVTPRTIPSHVIPRLSFPPDSDTRRRSSWFEKEDALALELADSKRTPWDRRRLSTIAREAALPLPVLMWEAEIRAGEKTQTILAVGDTKATGPRYWFVDRRELFTPAERARLRSIDREEGEALVMRGWRPVTVRIGAKARRAWAGVVRRAGSVRWF